MKISPVTLWDIEERPEMLMDQKLDLTLAVTMLPMLVELHHVGISFKSNT